MKEQAITTEAILATLPGSVREIAERLGHRANIRNMTNIRARLFAARGNACYSQIEQRSCARRGWRAAVIWHRIAP